MSSPSKPQKAFHDRLNDTIHWERLIEISDLSIKKIGLSNAAFVPLLALVVSAYNVYFHKFDLHLSLGASLAIIYFSSLLFFVAGTATKVFCPREIKQHRVLPKYILAIQEQSNLVKEAFGHKEDSESQIDAALPEVPEELSQLASKEFSYSELNSLDQKVFERYYRRIIATAADDWKQASKSRKYLRYSIALLYSISFLGSAYILVYYTPLDVIHATW